MASSSSIANSTETVEHFFRHEYGKAVAYLVKRFGPDHIELIEDSIQDTMIKAMRTWPFHEIPDNPSAWIIRSASNRLIDLLRRASKSHSMNTDLSKFDELTSDSLEKREHSIRMETELADDQLKMFFACCDPILSEKSQVILTLKLLCGFSKNEIAQSLLLSSDAVAKAFTRAKEKLKQDNLQLLTPSPKLVKERLNVVLKIIYLLFNEGYKPSSGGTLIKKDLCLEAIRLTHILLQNKHYNLSKVNALMALMCLQSSRFEARVSKDGELIPLALQDRKKWNQELIQQGIYYLVQASDSNHLTEYHVQASIAAYHCTAKSNEDIEWDNILRLYDYQITQQANPITSLNRCVAYGKVHGPKEALREMASLNKDGKLDNHYLYHAVRGTLHNEAGQLEEAFEELTIAKQITDNTIEKNYLHQQLESISGKMRKLNASS